jgi:glucose/arabinose dehydrogenase
LPPPDTSLIPTVHFSIAAGWPQGAHPTAPPGFEVTRYAGGLDNPRWLTVLPNGDVLVAESRTVPHPANGIMDAIGNFLQRNSGVQGTSADRITLLRDSTGTGRVDLRTVFLSHLHQPFGMAVIDNAFYVANTNSVWRFAYNEGDTTIAGAGVKIVDLPEGGYNNHWTRNLIVSPDKSKIYVTVGSGSNVGENGAANEIHRADILEFNPDGSGLRIFASGLRNPCGLGWAPDTGTLWTVVNERDMLGNDLVPDYLTSVNDGDFFGWPYSYWGKHLDPRVTPQRPDLVAHARAPDYSLGAHVASLGLVFYTADAFPEHYRGGAFIGEHGSWNRAPFSGYAVVYVPFKDGKPSGPPEPFLWDFMSPAEPGTVRGRPVGVAIDKTGALLVADDVGNTVWRVAPKTP